jgi:putative transposase
MQNYLNLSWINETSIRVGSDFVWLWVVIEPTDRTILGIRISVEKNMLVSEQFIQSLIKRCDMESTINISTNGDSTWYPPQACRFLNVKHHNHYSSIEKSFIERTIQYIKDRTECFDDYFPCTRFNCKLEYV